MGISFARNGIEIDKTVRNREASASEPTAPTAVQLSMAASELISKLDLIGLDERQLDLVGCANISMRPLTGARGTQ
jgi:hypothetical protein